MVETGGRPDGKCKIGAKKKKHKKAHERLHEEGGIVEAHESSDVALVLVFKEQSALGHFDA